MRPPSGSDATLDGAQDSDSYYRRLRSADWVEGPSRLPERVETTSHLAAVYEDDREERIPAQFIGHGLQAGADCVVVDADPATDIWDDGLDSMDAPGTLRQRTVDTLFEASDRASAEELVTGFQETVTDSADSDANTRVTLQVGPLSDRIPYEELRRFEVRLTDVCRDSDLVVLSEYSRADIDSKQLTALLRAHPYVVADDTASYNPWYLPPSEFFSSRRSERTLESHLDAIVTGTSVRTELDELRRRNEELKVFAHSISHDLRNPLQTAIGRAETLPDDHEQVQVVRDALGRIERLIDDGLEMIHGEDLSKETASFRALATKAWGLVDSGEADLTVTEDFSVNGDPSRIKQLLENLFRNSMEYAGPNPSVRIGPIEQIHAATRADREEGYAGFFVEDDGPGVPAEQRGEIFELGVSSGNGTGYGLAIVKKIVQAHDWSIYVSSSVDGGARFEITGVEAYPE